MRFVRQCRRATFVASLAVCVIADTIVANPLWGHGGLVPLETWGAFPPTAAYCQRVIGMASATCALQAARLRQECFDKAARGLACDETATTAAIAAARRDTLDLIDVHCSERDAQTIGYLGSFDLQADIIRFCREWEAISASAVFGALPQGSGPLPPDQYACVAATAATAAKLAQITFDAWRATMNRIAVRSFDLPSKTAMIDRTSARVGGFEPNAVDALDSSCAAAGFATIYHKSTAQFVTDLVARANCLPSAFYLQNKLSCPPGVCGNWIIEPGETCDDGNIAEGDGCDRNCQAEGSR